MCSVKLYSSVVIVFAVVVIQDENHRRRNWKGRRIGVHLSPARQVRLLPGRHITLVHAQAMHIMRRVIDDQTKTFTLIIEFSSFPLSKNLIGTSVQTASSFENHLVYEGFPKA